MEIFCSLSLCRLKAAINPLSLQSSTNTFANSADPDKTAHNEPSHQDLHCLLFWIYYLQQWVYPNSEIEESLQTLRGERVE